jgi:hypothetical protein
MNTMRVVLTGHWASGRRTKSPMNSRLAANSLGTKLPNTHSPGDTEKGDRSPGAENHIQPCADIGEQVTRSTGRCNTPLVIWSDGAFQQDGIFVGL